MEFGAQFVMTTGATMKEMLYAGKQPLFRDCWFALPHQYSAFMYVFSVEKQVCLKKNSEAGVSLNLMNQAVFPRSCVNVEKRSGSRDYVSLWSVALL